MMQQKVSSGNDCGDGNSSNGQLLRDIEEISKALYLQKAPQEGLVSRPAGRSKSVEKPRLSELNSTLNPRNVSSIVSFKDKKPSSGWNWKKPLKALTHIGYQKFNVCFFLHVHSIEGLPLSCSDMNLFVQLKRKDEVLQTRPFRVVKGIAEFNETLLHKCCVYGSRSGPHNSAKYEAKLFLIYASVVGAPGIDMGKHWIDLARLLPATLEELEGQKSTGKWTTSFKLEGMAKGATLNVSFGFSLVKDNLSESRRNMIVSELVNLVDERSCMPGPITSSRLANSNGMLRRVGSVPSDLDRRSPRASQSVDSKIYDDVSSNLGLELSNSIKFLYQKLNEVNIHSSEKLRSLSEDVKAHKLKLSLEFEPDKDNSGYEDHSSEFTIIDQGVEMPKKEDLVIEGRDIHPVDDIGIETIDVDEIFKDDDTELDEKKKIISEDGVSDNYAGLVLVDDCEYEESSTYRKGSCIEEELELALNNFLTSESADLEYPLSMCEFVEQENYMETKSNYKADKVIERSCSLDELTESVASDFLNMLGVAHSPFRLSSDSDLDSPRGRLLREFEEEAISSGNYFIECNAESKDKEFNCVDPSGSDCGDLSWDFNFSTAEDHKRASQLLTRRRKAKVLEDLETEALMKEWGLNEEAFQNTPRHCSDGFGSPVELLPEESVELPSLGDGLGPCIQIKDGGFVRSMNPSLFKNSKNVGSLVMQVSHPVVLPAELGSDIIEILQHLASFGIERLSSQLNKLMPMEDINGKTLQQVAHNAAIPVRQIPLCCESLFDQDTILDAEMEPDYVTVEQLLPFAMNTIQTMSMEGLKIQSGMSEEEVPASSVGPKPIIKMPAFEGKRANLGWFLSSEGAAELRALDAEERGSDIDRLLDLSLTLQDWLRLDAGIIDDEDQVSEHAVNILAAHHAKCMGFKASGRRQGILGNNLTLAFMLLLRDPFRNYEPVGASMIALVQVERSFFHFKPMFYNTALDGSSNECIQNKDTDEDRSSEQCTLGFKITEVHLSGLKTEPGKTQHWGTKTQQQYGTRWLLACGVSKASKQSFSKSTAVVASHRQLRRRIRNKDVLWSISGHENDTRRNWKDSMGLVQYMRNPDVMFA
ncbi:protein PLASTID MOVEMENT IMPAIRED 1-RELATED 2 [Mercurialis annua]|uniref:protein PLASTID MOVEMENT IMPAIRED 1-RELATED 2 n=1 Tax=Mercurialis annua TaxID=3986 RepID=UPI00216037A6|nr:protein PLASTID MOVEMENT IMPAIRED 1-RELATED 2 [Mercurialis annua]